MIGKILLEPSILQDVAQYTRGCDLSAPASLVFSAMHDVGAIDIVTLAERLKLEGQWEASGGARFLVECMDRVHSAKGWEALVELLDSTD